MANLFSISAADANVSGDGFVLAESGQIKIADGGQSIFVEAGE